MAHFRLNEEVRLDPQAIRKAVAKLNFTPNELRIRLRGQIVPWTWEEEPPVEHPETRALKIERTGQLFLLADSPEQRDKPETPLKQLVAAAEEKSLAVVTGTVHQHTEDLPLGLVVECYEPAPEGSH